MFRIFGPGPSLGGPRNQPERVPRVTKGGCGPEQDTDYFGTKLEPLWILKGSLIGEKYTKHEKLLC